MTPSTKWCKRFVAAGAVVVALSGCATLEPELAFESVAADVRNRTGTQISWSPYEQEGSVISASVRGYLARELTPRSAVQIAVLNNRKLQSLYTDVGIAQAGVVEAATFKNPVVDGAVTWFNDAGGAPNLAFGVAWSFIDLLYVPLRKSVAESELEEAKIRVAGEVIDHAAKTQLAYFDYVAAKQEVTLFTSVERSTRANVITATSLRKAGNITALQFEQQQTQHTRAKLQLAQALATAAERRERLNVLMGLTGSDTEWRAPMELMEVPPREIPTGDAERWAVERSVDIEGGRQRLTTLGRRFNLVRRSSLVPELDLGVEYEREVEVEEGEKNIRQAAGPTFGFEIPIFDRGEAEKANARLQLIKAEHELWDIAVRVRSAARTERARLLTARKTAIYYRDAILPESKRLLRGTQRDFNAMQEDVFRLLTVKRTEILAGQEYIRALQAYWSARARFQQLMNGKLPDGGGGGVMEVAAGEGGGEEDH